MNNLGKIHKELEKSGKGGKISEVANSDDGKKIGQMVDGKALKKAAITGDKDTVNKILQQVMATDEGKRMMKKIAETFMK